MSDRGVSRRSAGARRPRLAVAPIVVCLALGTGVGTVEAAGAGPAGATGRAGSASSVSQRLRQLRQLVGEASAQEAALVDQLNTARAARASLDEKVAVLDAQVGDATNRLQVAELQLERVDGGYFDLDRRVADTDSLLSDARQRFDVSVAQLYEQQGGQQAALYASLVLHEPAPHDVFVAGRYLLRMSASRQEDVHHLATLKSLSEQLRDQLGTQRADARAARDQVATDRARLDGLRNQEAQVRAAAVDQEAREQQLLAIAAARKAEFTSQLVALEAVSNDIARFLRSRQAYQVLQPSGHGIFRLPVVAPLTSPFGPRVDPIFGDIRIHTGIDLGASYGDAIRAAGNGVVVWAGPYGGYGNAVVIDHGNALATLYAHQSRVAVGQGQSVRAGQTIGYVGSTGLSTGPHLHFEVRVRGVPVDPLGYL